MGCRRTAPADALVRLSSRPGGDVAVGGGPGRGAWLCRDPACLERAVRRGGLGRALRAEVGPGAIVRLRTLIAEGGPSGEAAPQVWEDGGSGRLPGQLPNEEKGP